MITDEELERIMHIRELVEAGNADAVSLSQRQWIVDVFRREKIPMTVEMYDGAAEAGLDVEGIEVNYE